MNVCCIQMDVRFADPAHNFARAEALLRRAAKKKPDVILLPEVWNTGFAPRKIDPALADENGARTKALCSAIAREYGVNIVAGSVLCRKPGGVHNTSFVFDRTGACIAEQDKTHLFSPAGEGEQCQSGAAIEPFSLDGVPCGVMICYDLRFAELARALALSGAKVLFIPAQWPKQRVSQMLLLLRARAVENQLYAALCNGCGSADGVTSGGHSAMINPLGEVLARAGSNERTIFTALDLAAQERIRSEIPVFLDRRPDLYLSLCDTNLK